MFTLGRKIDIHYKTNKVILIFSLIISILGYLVTKDIKSALYIGGGTFISWALAREIDPKHEYSAFVAAALNTANLFYFKEIGILGFLWILLTIRLVNGISGEKTSTLDIILVFALTMFITINNKNGVYFLPFIIGVIILMKNGIKNKANLIFLSLAFMIFIVEIFYFEYFHMANIKFTSFFTIVSILLPIAYIFIKKYISIDGLLDDKGELASKKRVRDSQTLFAATIVILILFSNISLNTLIIYISVISGIIIYSLFLRLYKKIKKDLNITI
ncbi:MAG: hypothetical protein GX752_01370 [Clostridium sp.]|nr:hypothetical protein [Clostridium sp.]